MLIAIQDDWRSDSRQLLRIQLLRMVGLTPHFIQKPRRDVPPERLYNCVECRKIVR
jgi:hypothetical protein